VRRSGDETRGLRLWDKPHAAHERNGTGEKPPPRKSWLRQHRSIQSRRVESDT
jgi:hypothetical protein